MQPPLRIAILECDTPLDGTREKYGGYGGVFTALLKAGAATLQRGDITSSTGLDITAWNVEKGDTYPSLGDIDAILITGSRYNAFDTNPWIEKLVRFTRKAIDDERVRVIGVCFGHQIVARALGTKVDRSDAGWEASVCEVDMNERGFEIFGKKKLHIHQMHRDIVTAMPTMPNTNEKLDLLGSSPKCQYQSFYCKNKVISVQGHPEFNEGIVRELLETRHKAGIFDDAMFKDTMSRVGNAQDGVHVAGVFLRFLLAE